MTYNFNYHEVSDKEGYIYFSQNRIIKKEVFEEALKNFLKKQKEEIHEDSNELFLSDKKF